MKSVFGFFRKSYFMTIYSRKDDFFELWLQDEKNIQDKLFRYVDINKWKKNNLFCKKIHKSNGYEFMSSNDIYKKILELIENTLQ